MDRTQLAHQLAYQFALHKYMWKKEGADELPTEEDFLEAFEWIENNLKEGESMFVGRLAVTKSEGHTDIYLYQGELT